MTAKPAEVRVKDLMVRDVVSVRPGDLLSEAVSLMFENQITAMPVVDARRRCKGILSTTDLVAPLLKRPWRPDEAADGDQVPDQWADLNQPGSPLGGLKVAEVMTTDVMTVSLEDTILDATREMLRNRVHRLVVVDAQQRVIGILSTMDLLEAFAAGA